MFMNLRRVNHKNGFRCGLMLTLHPIQGKMQEDSQMERCLGWWGWWSTRGRTRWRGGGWRRMTKEWRSKFLSWDISFHHLISFHLIVYLTIENIILSKVNKQIIQQLKNYEHTFIYFNQQVLSYHNLTHQKPTI